MSWDGDKNEYLTRERDGNPVIGVRQYRVNPEHCCEACVFGRGEHSGWCKPAPVECLSE
jgi:hypothetical protein